MATSSFKSATKRPFAASGSGLSQSSPETDADYHRNAPRGKFVNTKRGSGAPICLDDLALEFFSSSNESDEPPDRKERPGRSGSRLGRWASDTASSRRRARSVSRTRASGIGVSGSSTSGGKNVISNEVGSGSGSRRRRSLSVARYQISDSESEVDSFRDSSKSAAAKALGSWNNQNSSGRNATPSSNRRLGRSRSHKNISILHDGYSSHPSALTDDDWKDSQFGKNGFEKIIREVYAEKCDYPSADAANGGLYEVMRKEIRCAVEDICTELNQKMGINQTVLENSQSESFEEKETCPPKKSEERPENLIEEAEQIFEDFICNVEDGGMSFLNDETSSSLGGTMKSQNSVTVGTESYPAPVEMEGVILPWLEWETSHDSFQLGHTPKAALQKGMVQFNDESMCSVSSHGSWSPGIFESPQMGRKQGTSESRNGNKDSFDMGEYKRLENNEDLLFEVYRQQNRIKSGGLLLCTHPLY
ncbi:uncharacterized protein LOC127243380 [Andrographis paniculata]|uniref:uncharacterized protein LOC127243380 n=1 Tax=Andrographis paniculata TaxID=175694 RepID=UPI0021E81113|nr:uncharacterized protein LOC127243380 [Andrographis paniculata]